MPLTLDPANAIAPMSLDSPSDNAMTALYRVALGPVNAEHYLPIFARFDDAGRTTTTWNWPAALFTLSWLVFRQLWGAALVYVAAAEGLALLVFGVGRQFLHWPQQVEWGILAAIVLFSCALPGLFANAVLHTEIRKRIARALSASRTVPEACTLLENQASSRQRLSGVIIAHVVVVATAIVAYLLFPPGDAPEQPHSTASGTVVPPATNPTSGLAAVSVVRAASTPPEAVASGPVSALDAPTPAPAPVPAQESTAPASVARAPVVVAPPPPAPPAAPPTAAEPPASSRQASRAPAPAASAAPASAALKAVAPAVAAPAPRAAASAPPPTAAPGKPAPAAASSPASAARTRASSPATPASRAVPLPAAAPAASRAAARPAPAAASAAASAASDAEPATVGSAPGFYINVGLFAEEANARKTQSRLLNEGLPAFRQPLDGAKGRRIRVRVGPFDTKAAADAAAQTIQGMGLDAVIFKK